MRNAHPTKRGPGRFHKSGQAHGAVPAPSKGAPVGHVQRVNPARAARSAVKAAIGARQYRKQRKALAASAREGTPA